MTKLKDENSTQSEKEFDFINDQSKKEFLDLPKELISQFGSDLNAVQQDKRPWSEFKDISKSVGPGAIELIENGSPGYRVVYCAKFENTVFILHSFTKTTNGVDRAAMKTAKERYKLMMDKVRKKQRERKKA